MQPDDQSYERRHLPGIWLAAELQNDSLSLFHQVRLDFEEVELLDPDSTGACRTDYMHVTGGVSQVFLTSSLKSSSWPPLPLNSLQSLNSHNPDWFIYSNISFHFLIVSSTRPCQPCVVPWQASTSSTRRYQTSPQGFSKFTIIQFSIFESMNYFAFGSICLSISHEVVSQFSQLVIFQAFNCHRDSSRGRPHKVFLYTPMIFSVKR